MKTGILIMQNSKHLCSTNILSGEYIHEQMKETFREIGGHFCTNHTQVNAFPSQTTLNEHYQGDIIGPKLPFPKWVRKVM